MAPDFLATIPLVFDVQGCLVDKTLRDHLAASGNALLSGSGSTGAVIDNIAVISPTQLRVTFTLPVIDNPALNNIINYETSPSLTLVSVTPESGYSGDGPTYVDIETSEQVDGESYTFTIYNIEPASE